MVRFVSWLISLLVLALAARSSVGQPSHPADHARPATAAQARAVIESFDAKLREIDALLVDGDPQAAYEEAEGLLQRMTRRLMSGPDVGRFLSLATVLRALAAYDLGRRDEARWHWHVAVQLFPDVANLQMTAYGEAGPYLKRNLPPTEREYDVESDPGKALHSQRPSGIKPPRRRHTPYPRVPRARRGSGTVEVVVEVIIQTDGTVKTPRIVETGGELTLVCTTLDAIREWRFAPAREDGVPVEVYYNLAVRFET